MAGMEETMKQLTLDEHQARIEHAAEYAAACADTRPCWHVRIASHGPNIIGTLAWGDDEFEAIVDSGHDWDEVVSVVREGEQVHGPRLNERASTTFSRTINTLKLDPGLFRG